MSIRDHHAWLLFSHSAVSDSLWPHGRQDSLSSTSSQSFLKLMSIELVMPSKHLILCHPLLLSPSIFPSIRVFFRWVSSSPQVAKGLEFQLQHQSFWWIFRTDSDGLVGSPCCPRDSQECSPPPQFEGINSLVLCLLRGPTLTSIRDYWKNHSFAYMQLCQQSDVCAFLIHCLGLLQPFFQGANVFSFHGCSHCPQGFWSPRK